MTSEQSSVSPPTLVDAATLNFWHESLSINEISDQLGIEPEMWFEDGCSMETGPKHVGNKCILMASGPSAIPELIARVRPHTVRLRALQSQGLRTHLTLQCSPSKTGKRLPSIDVDSDQFLSDLCIDILISWREIKRE